MMLKQWLRAGIAVIFHFIVAPPAKRDEVGQLIRGFIVSIEHLVWHDVMNAVTIALQFTHITSAYLAFIPVTPLCRASLPDPIRASTSRREFALSVLMGWVSVVKVGARQAAIALVADPSLCEFLSAPLADDSFRGCLSRCLVTDSRAVNLLWNLGMKLLGANRARLHIGFGQPVARAAAVNLFRMPSRDIEYLAASGTHFCAEGWSGHSAFTSRCLPDVASAGDGKSRFLGATLADALSILPRNGAMRYA